MQVLEFFAGTEIDCELVEPTKLRLGSRSYDARGIPTQAMRRRGWIDAQVMAIAPQQLVSSIERYLKPDRELRLAARHSGYAVMRGNEHLALVSPTHASLRHSHIVGNFLRPGDHWQDLRERISRQGQQAVGEEQAAKTPAGRMSATKAGRGPAAYKTTRVERRRIAKQNRQAKRFAELREFFAGTSIAYEVGPNGDVQLGSAIVGKIDAVPASATKQHAWIDRKLMTATPDEFLAVVREHLADLRESLSAVARARGYAVLSNGQPLVLVCPTHARFRGGGKIEGNFLRDGAHWQRLRERLARSLEAADSSKERKVAPREAEPTHAVQPERDRVVVDFPEQLDSELVDRGRRASERIRVERNFAFDHPVVVSMPAARNFRFEPIRQTRALEVPFKFQDGSQELAGALRLRTPQDPLALAIEKTESDGLVGVGWALALCAYAELTCVEQAPIRHKGAGEERRYGGSSRDEQGDGPPRRRALPQPRLKHSAELVPTAATMRFLATYVVGHKRLLQPGHARSRDAELEAGAIGVTLRDGETWVRPHARGLPQDEVLRFSWRMPRFIETALRSSGS